MTHGRVTPVAAALAIACAAGMASLPSALDAADTLQPPEQFIGFRVGTDNELARWDKIVEYMRHAAATSDRVRYRELGRTSGDNPLVAVELASPDTLKNLDRYKQME